MALLILLCTDAEIGGWRTVMAVGVGCLVDRKGILTGHEEGYGISEKPKVYAEWS